jgi:hypothetical protein
VALRARAVFAREFNAWCDSHGNKADLLTHVTLQLVDEVLDSIRDVDADQNTVPRRTDDRPRSARSRCLIVCDKHGGRNHYAAAVAEQFPGASLAVCREGRTESRYIGRAKGVPVDIRFRRGGESFLPTALASMAAKYVRELAMQAFNAFWQRHVPNLRPTAGYPVDAKRFRRDIAATQSALQIDDALLWRAR